MTALENIIVSRARLRAALTFPRNTFFTDNTTKHGLGLLMKIVPSIALYLLNLFFSSKNHGIFHSIALRLIGRLDLLLKSNAVKHPIALVSVFFIAGAALVRTNAWKRVLRHGVRLRQQMKA